MNTYWKKRISAVLACGMLAMSFPVATLAEEPAESPVETPVEETKPQSEEVTSAPTEEPTEAPTDEPTEEPITEPSEEPTAAPADEATATPTGEATAAPTEDATEVPTEESTQLPEDSPAPVSTTLFVTQKQDLSDMDLSAYEDILVEVGGEISGGVIRLPVENHGVISGGTFVQTVVNCDGAIIQGGSFDAQVENKKGAVIRKGAFNLSVENNGTIEDGSFIGYEPKDEKDETPARTVLVENQGTIEGGEFSICTVRNAVDGEITGGRFAQPVILPDGSTAALDFGDTHEKLKGGMLCYLPLKIFAMLDVQKNEVVIMPLNPQERLLGYALTVVCGDAQYDVSGEWTPAEDGYVHIPVAEEWSGGKALATVGYLSAADAQEAAATAELELPGVQFALTAEVDYAGESVTLRTDEALGEGWKLAVSPLPQAAVDYVAAAVETEEEVLELEWQAGADEMTFNLAELRAEPDSAGEAATYGVQLQLHHGEAGASEALMLTLPARAAFSGKTTGLKGTFRGPTEIELSSAQGIETAMALPDTQPETLKVGKLYKGLKSSTVYHIWVRDAAVEGESFASQWKLAATTTTQSIAEVSFSPAKLTVKWSPSLGVPKLTFDTGKLTAGNLSYHWMNEKGESGTGAPKNAGNYQIICALSESKAKWYRLRNDALEYTIEPLKMTLANTKVYCENLVYTGKEQLPESLTITVDGVKIPASEFTISKISGQDYSKTGVKKLRLTGKGNVTGSIEFSYTIYSSGGGSSWGSASSGWSDANENEVEGEESGVEEISYVSDNGENLRERYLGVDDDPEQVCIVYDVLDEAQDYELLPVYNARENGEDVENILIVAAQPDADGEILARTLRLRLDQLKRLYEEGGFDVLLFRNGDGEAYLRLEELFSGNAAKLTMLMLVTQAEEIDMDALNFDALVETQLADEQLAQVDLELRVEPIILSNELEAWEAGAWLSKDGLDAEISALLPGITIGMNVNGLFEEGEEESFAAKHALALVNLEDADAQQVRRLESTLELIPGEGEDADESEYYEVFMPTGEEPEVLVEYTAQTDLEPYRNYIMTAPYPGEGAYLVVGVGE